MRKHMVGIGEIKLANKTIPELKVLALGSCVGVIFYAWRINTVAVAHVALPDSAIGNVNNKEVGYFADTAIEKMVQMFKKLNVQHKRDINIKLVGGASIMDPKNTFDIGKRNILAIRKHLWNFNLGALSEDVGQDFSRTVVVKPVNGEVIISSPNRGSWTL